jgi:hypothetical protein
MRNPGVCALLLLLSSCAANEVRLEYAGTVASQAKQVTDATNKYVEGVQARRREASITLLANNPQCQWGEVIKIDRQWQGGDICNLVGVPVDRQQEIRIGPLSDEALKGLTAAVVGVAAYRGALAEVLDEKPFDAKTSIDEAISMLTTASADLNRIAGSTIGSKTLNFDVLKGDQVASIVTLIDALIDLQQTDLKVQKVRAVTVKIDGQKLFDDLAADVTSVGGLHDASSALRLRDNLKTAYERAAPGLTFDERRERLRQIAAADDEVSFLTKKRVQALTDAVIALKGTDLEFRRALAGEFTEEKRREIARRNRKMVLSILSKLAAVFPAAA